MKIKEFINYSIRKKFEDNISKFRENLNKLNYNISIKLFDYLKIKNKTNNNQRSISSLSYIKLDEEKNIIITPINNKDIKSIENCIKTSELDISFINTGYYIKVIKKQLTAERKNNLIKLIKRETESTKINIRNIRKNLNEEIKKLFNLKKDKNELKFKLEECQKLTDEYILEIDKIFKEKLINLTK